MIHCRVLLPHPIEPRLLMLRAHGEWRLPAWHDSAEHEWYETLHVNRAVAARFGMESSVLRCALDRHDPITGVIDRVYELENHSALHDTIPAATWVGERELDLMNVPDPETRELLHGWYSRERGEQFLSGPPWFRRGWFIEALAWCVDRLRAAGLETTARPDQLRATERSFVMRIATDRGNVFFRAVPPGLEHAPAVAEWLARRFPLNVPASIAMDHERGWLLQSDGGGGALPLGEEREEEEWYRAARRMAEIQIESAHHVHQLRELGCPSRGLDVLAHRIPRLCADSSAMLLGQPGGLSRRQIERVAALVPTLLTLCEELASIPLPECIDYGQLRARSVLSTLNEPVYLDWSRAALSHPFFAIAHLVADAVRLLPSASIEARRRIRDSYLAPWRNVVPQQALLRAFEIARRLAPVHLAAAVHAELIPFMSQPWEVAGIVPAQLRITLDLLHEHDPRLLL